MSSRRYFLAFLATSAGLTLAVVALNLIGSRVLTAHPSKRSLQLLSAFARATKPAWLAEDVTASHILIGTSRVRDAFDPLLIERELACKVFNYGVSGGTAYETFRYTQDALARPQTKVVIIAADTFSVGSVGQPTGSGFDEAKLSVTPAGTPTPNRAFQLFMMRYASGGAVGLNAQALWLLQRQKSDQAEQRPDLYNAYQRMDVTALREGQAHHQGRSIRLTPYHTELMIQTMTLFCGRSVQAIIYFPPDHLTITEAWRKNDAQGLADYKAGVTEAVKQAQALGANIVLYDFMTSNVVTLDNVAADQPSVYFREPVHVRPPVGVLLLQRMLSDQPLTNAPDFGVKVL